MSVATSSLVGRTDLPLPVWLFLVAAAVVLAVSFAALVVLWREPRLERAQVRWVVDVPRRVRAGAGAAGVAIFALVVWSGLAGTPTPTENLAPTFVYVVVGVALVAASALLGDVFRLLSPWGALARAARACARRAGAEPGPPRPYPRRLGSLPAVLPWIGFAWVQYAALRGADPHLLATVAVAYAGAQLVGMSVYGIETWEARGDALAVYLRLVSKLSPIAFDGHRVGVRLPLSGFDAGDLRAGTAALACVAIGATSYSGLEATRFWRDQRDGLEGLAVDLGARTLEQVRVFPATAGLIALMAIALAAYALSVALMPRRGSGVVQRLAAFAPSLIPLAVVYTLAHAVSLLVYQAQALPALVSDPLGRGSDVLGTAEWQIDYGAVSFEAVWYLQVLLLIAGHVAGLVLAHERALVLYRDARAAGWSQVCVLAVMVAFTCSGLGLLAAISV